jgi:aryl-alcohol dehydrogenase-like predicted oxidoreductase
LGAAFSRAPFKSRPISIQATGAYRIRVSSARHSRKNLALAEEVKALAARKHCTAAQLALAWVLAQGNDMVPIPGTKRVKYLEDNMGALEVELSRDDLSALDHLFPPGAAHRRTLHAGDDGNGAPLTAKEQTTGAAK